MSSIEKYNRSFVVRSYESGVRNSLTMPNLCNYLQEIAGNHADVLNLGIGKLQTTGVSWMLSRLRVRVFEKIQWGEDLSISTWPSGMKGRLVATRDFEGRVNGKVVFEGVSEWLVVDLTSQKIVKLPESFSELAPEGTERVSLAESTENGGKFSALTKEDAKSRILGRKSDHDFNDHVNNVHYVEWCLEAMPEGFAEKSPVTLDIIFRASAHAGDELESRSEIIDDNTLRHIIVRLSDGAVLATAQIGYRDAP